MTREEKSHQTSSVRLHFPSFFGFFFTPRKTCENRFFLLLCAHTFIIVEIRIELSSLSRSIRRMKRKESIRQETRNQHKESAAERDGGVADQSWEREGWAGAWLNSLLPRRLYHNFLDNRLDSFTTSSERVSRKGGNARRSFSAVWPWNRSLNRRHQKKLFFFVNSSFPLPSAQGEGAKNKNKARPWDLRARRKIVYVHKATRDSSVWVWVLRHFFVYWPWMVSV